MVVIIIVNFNGEEDTILCVKSLLLSTYTNYHILIVDNASNINSVKRLSTEFALHRRSSRFKTAVLTNQDGVISLIIASKNGGFAYANNIGIQYAKTEYDNLEYLWFLNNDTIVLENTLAKLSEHMRHAKSDVGIIGNKLMFLDNKSIIQAIGGFYNKYMARCSHIGSHEIDLGQYDRYNQAMDYIVGASMFVKIDFINDVGLMCEEYFLYFEELDWLVRGKKKNWTFCFNPYAIVYHKEGGSTKTSTTKVSEIADICQIKNRILFTYKYYPLYLLTVLPSCLATIIHRAFKGDFQRSYILLHAYLYTIKNIIYGKA